MKYIMQYLLFVCLIFTSTHSFSQCQNNNITILPINQKVKNHSDIFDLSTPLSSYISFANIMMWGRRSLERSAYSDYIRCFMSPTDVLDKKVSQDLREEMMERTIKEIVIYKDSVAGVITDYKDSLYLIRYLNIEDSKWVNRGEGLGEGMIQTRESFIENAPLILNKVRRVIDISSTQFDTTAFIQHIDEYKREPVAFILDALAKYKITIYGEIHRRKVSWQLMKDIINHPDFSKNIGTVFVEISSHSQSKLDDFFTSDILNTKLLLDIFQEIQLLGWYDRGMYEFLIELWNLNKKLPNNEKLKIVAIDIPRPFNSLKTQEAYNKHFSEVKNRDLQMADIIEETIISSTDTRNTFFIVGALHAYKSPVFSPESLRQKSKNIAVGGILSERFSTNNVYTIYTHAPIITNNGLLHGKIRNGFFDYIFLALGNKPTAFDLKNSPFGQEPFDGLYEIAFELNAGKFEDNYDGYIFLEALEEEEAEYVLYEIFTDNFITELKRRAMMLGAESSMWYGTSPNNLTKEIIINKLKQRNENSKRWTNLE